MLTGKMDGINSLPGTGVDGAGQADAEQMFPESESRFRSFFEQSSDAFLILYDGLFVDCNTAAVRLLGCDDKQGIVLRSLAELSPELQPDGTPSMIKAREMIARALAEGSHRFEWLHLKADDSELPVEVALSPMSLGERWVMHVIWRDISERKQVEFREQTRLEILEKMASGAALPSLLEAIVTFVEKNSPGALCSILVGNDEGTRLRHGAAPSLPDYYNEAVNGLRIKEGKGSCGTAAFRRKRVVVEDIAGHPYWNGFEPATQAGLRSCWSEPVLSPEGNLLGTFATYHREPRAPGSNEIALIESAAHLAGIAIGWARDNERRNALEEHVRQMQKMEAVGQLTGGIAHDFNNLLTPIMGYAEIIRATLGKEHPCVPKIDCIIAATMKSRALVQKLLSFSRKQNLDMAGVDLNRVIESFKDIIRHTIRANISVHTRLAPMARRYWPIRGRWNRCCSTWRSTPRMPLWAMAPSPLPPAMSFSMTNSSDVTPGSNRAPISSWSFPMTAAACRRMWRGISSSRFYTTKPAGRGTGLGLATTFGIIRQHGGHIKVRSTVGEGTTFSLYFPENVSAAKEAARPAVDLRFHVPHDKTILFVDDNEMILEMAEGYLEMYGYKVLTAALPSPGPWNCRRPSGSIDLLITDVVMPEMNGPELYERLLANKPNLPVLYISGYKNDVVALG
jgi:two-component system, cell cycle sensor histidine kinase and response regulator CckA